MNLNRKLEIVSQSILSISTHTDEDAAVRAAALDRVINTAQAQKKALDAEVQAGIAAALGSAEPA